MCSSHGFKENSVFLFFFLRAYFYNVHACTVSNFCPAKMFLNKIQLDLHAHEFKLPICSAVTDVYKYNACQFYIFELDQKTVLLCISPSVARKKYRAAHIFHVSNSYMTLSMRNAISSCKSANKYGNHFLILHVLNMIK